MSNADVCIINARVVAMDSSLTTTPVNCVAFHHGKIAWMGASDDPHRPQAHSTLDAQGMLLTPGLIDCHTHVIYADPEGVRIQEFKQKTQGVSYQSIAHQGGGIRATMHATRHASEDVLYRTALRNIRDLIAWGVTTLEIKASYAGDLEGSLRELRVARTLQHKLPITCRITWCPQIVPPEFSNEHDYITHVCDVILPAIAQHQAVDAVDVFCEKEGIGLSAQGTQQIFAKAHALGLSIKCHADQLSDQQGAKIVADWHGLSADHLEYTSEESVRVMAQAGTVAVLLPGAFYYQREQQKPPIALFRQYNVPMAVATDCNPGSSPITSPLWAMNLACIAFGLSTEEAFAGVTRNAARALGLQSTHGMLHVGYAADAVLWDAQSVAELIYRCSHNTRVHTWKNGIMMPSPSQLG